jgi:two-component system, cell cycle response regulator DivK
MAQPWKDKTVLVVEDDEINYFYLKTVLNPTGCSVLRAVMGNDVEGILQENKTVNLILMDIRLPDINGYEVTRKLRSLGYSLPIIAQTAYAMIGDRDLAIKSGCDDYISKPLSPAQLISLMEKYL